MAFPSSRLPITVELQINGVWTDISSDVRTQGGTDAISISRGIKGSGGRVADAETCSMTLDNNSGAYSNRNPLSPYYPYLGRNTPLRVSVAYGDPWLGVSEGGTERATTPDASVLDITGDIDVRVDLEPAVWGDFRGGTDSLSDALSFTELAGKWVNPGQGSWMLLLADTGQLYLLWSTTGADTFFASSVPIVLPPYTRQSVRVTLDVDNGSGGLTATFYTSSTPGTAGPWTPLGPHPLTFSGTTSIFNSTAPLNVGDLSTVYQSLAKKIYSVEVRSGIGGTVVANPAFTTQTVGATSFTDTAPSPRAWTVTSGALTNRYRRFTGEVGEWPLQWDTGAKDVTVAITASGPLQRYSQSKTVLQSTLRRRLPSRVPAYWPMEDGATATQLASPIAGVQPARFSGLTLASDGSLPGSGPLPAVTAPATLSAPVPVMATGDWQVELVYKLGSLPAAPTQMLQVNLASGTAANVQFLVGVAVARVLVADSTGATIDSFDFTPNNFTDGWGRLKVYTSTSGGTVTAAVEWDIIGVSTNWIVTTTYSGTPGRVTSVAGLWGTAFNGLLLGHLSVFPRTTSDPYDNADKAFAGETAAARLARLAGEQSLPMSVAGLAATTELVGPQGLDTLMDLFTGTAQADEGLLYEAREFAGLRYRARSTLYNQPSMLDLPYTTSGPQALMAPLRPVDDLQGVVNDSTVTRAAGSYGRSVVVTGPLSTLDPPNGIGTGYDENVTLNLYSDDQAAYHAGWRTHIGTWDEARFPQVNLSLEKSPALIPQVVRLDTGSRMRILPPMIPQLPPDAIDQLLLGYEESIAQFSWRLALACQPYGPYKVAVVGDLVLGRANTAGSQLNAGITATATSMQIATTSGPLWSTDSTQYPVDVRMGGEQITITAVTGSSSPQTATVVRSVNSVVKAQTAGTTITLATRVVAAL